ncbi:hypothetical protein AB1Y20_006264 [Prymnesium parvum]|uniref:AAA+ ATPase domain-containing protein n=1 Tax=Prymnesium parvum TaxID=97485 RepID=A0AB34J3H9_PRYPA
MSLLKRKLSSAKPAAESRGRPQRAQAKMLAKALVSNTAPSTQQSLLWTDKYEPGSSASLAMHKKKIEEIRLWLRNADASLQLGLPPTPRMLVLSGPPGSGKSTMLRVLARELGFELCEWVEPRAQGRPSLVERERGEAEEYESRVAQFEAFVRSSLRTLSLCLGNGPEVASTVRRRLVLLDELAVSSVSDGDSPMQRQQDILRRALPTARFPVVVILTAGSEAADSVHRQLERLAGPDAEAQRLVAHVNPVADTLLLKALRHVCAQEHLDLPAGALDAIVHSASGDLRSALHSLQFTAVGRARPAATMRQDRGGVRARAAAAECSVGRDRFPDLFRTIGKILNQPAKRARQRAEAAKPEAHAKEQREPQREHAEAPRDDSDDFAPEVVIQSSALDEGMVLAFLHHNYPSFFESVDDVADAAAALSDAATLMRAHSLSPWQPQLLPYVGSIGGRAVVSCNQLPAPPRFSQISKPRVFTVERLVLERRQQAVAAFLAPSGGTLPVRQSDIALQGSSQLMVEVLPMLQLLVARDPTGEQALTNTQRRVLTELAFSNSPCRSLPLCTPQAAAPPPAAAAVSRPICEAIPADADEIEESD